MFYRETGQFKSKYKEELAAFPLSEDKIGIGILLFLAYIAIPIFGIPGLSYEFTLSAIMIPVCIFTITTLGLNILLGFAGQISLGTGAFMGVGAYSCYKFMTIFPDLNILICVVLSGLVTAFVGMIFALAVGIVIAWALISNDDLLLEANSGLRAQMLSNVVHLLVSGTAMALASLLAIGVTFAMISGRSRRVLFEEE